MATVAMLVGGAIVNAVAFSGTNFLFSQMNGGEEERKRHDLALEELNRARDSWSKKRAAQLDYLDEKLGKQHHAERTFSDVESAMREYYRLGGTPDTLSLEREPQLSDFYTPSEQQQDAEIGFLVLTLCILGYVSIKYL